MPSTRPRSRREILLALGATVIILVAILLYCAFFGHPQNYDFAGCYTPGLISRQSGAAKIYDLQKQIEIQQNTLSRKEFLLYAYPPFHVLLFAPLARFSYAPAYVIWGFVNVALWILFVYLMRPHAPIPRDPLHYFMLCFLFLPAWANLVLGQNSLILLVLYALTFICLKRRQDYLAGMFLGLGLLKYHLVLPFALICLLRGKWRMMAGFVLTGSVLVALSFATVGSAGVLSYAHLLLDIARNPATPAYESFSPAHHADHQGTFRRGAGTRSIPRLDQRPRCPGLRWIDPFHSLALAPGGAARGGRLFGPDVCGRAYGIAACDPAPLHV